MRGVLVALFWIWVAVAVLVYGYRLYRRVAQGPKAQRDAKAAADEGRAVGLGEREGGRLSPGAMPPLPDGPVQPRLPRSLEGRPPPAHPLTTPPASPPGPGTPPVPNAHAAAVSPSAPTATSPSPVGGGAAALATAVPDPTHPDAPPPRPTVAEALRGIDLPCELVPVVDGDDPETTAGYRVLFTTRAATARAVAAGLADELERLGYQVRDHPTAESGETRQLQASRPGATVEVVVHVAADGAVAADVTT